MLNFFEGIGLICSGNGFKYSVVGILKFYEGVRLSLLLESDHWI